MDGDEVAQMGILLAISISGSKDSKSTSNALMSQQKEGCNVPNKCNLTYNL